MSVNCDCSKELDTFWVKIAQTWYKWRVCFVFLFSEVNFMDSSGLNVTNSVVCHELKVREDSKIRAHTRLLIVDNTIWLTCQTTV